MPLALNGLLTKSTDDSNNRNITRPCRTPKGLLIDSIRTPSICASLLDRHPGGNLPAIADNTDTSDIIAKDVRVGYWV